jgi:hypothetical protein
MSVIMYASHVEESATEELFITICQKCGRLIKINSPCECEALSLGMQSKK